MSVFDNEYYFIRRPRDERIPNLGPDKDSLEKVYQRQVLPLDSKPFIFHNARLESQLERNIIPIDPPLDILFNGSNLLICERIAEELRNLEIPNLAIQPAVYIDHKDVRHENYWFLTFLKTFDCWDRENSAYDPEPMRDLTPKYEIYTYSLNESLLQKTSLKERLLFEMGGTTSGYITVHESIADLFRVEWAEVLPITEY